MRELVSGSATGEVKLWDIRMDNPVRGFLAHTKGMRSLSVMSMLPLSPCIITPLFRYISIFINANNSSTVTRPGTVWNSGTLLLPKISRSQQ